MKRILLFAVALAAATHVPAHAARTTERLPTDVVPVRQDVQLRLDPRERSYSGWVGIDLEVRRASDRIVLHAEGLDVEGLTLVAGETLTDVEWSAPFEDVLEVRAAAPLAPGPARLTVKFRAPYDTTAIGLYRVESRGDAYAFTQFEADDAREAFPCFDEPAFKIPWRVTLTVPATDVAIANAPVESETTEGEWRTTTFRETPPLPSYLVAVAVGPFDLVDVDLDRPPMRIVTPRGLAPLATFAAENAPDVVRALEQWFESPYPFAKLDLIAVPEFWPGAMEHPGAITYRDTILLHDPATLTAGQRRAWARVTAHEVAHQWFGNLVTMEWWDDLWLNETFADWLGDRITDGIVPELGLLEDELQGVQGHLERDARPSAQPIRREVRPGDRLMDGVGVAYNKGKLVLAMFEEWMGAETFRRGVLEYLSEHSRGNATADDLWRALDRSSGRPVSAAMRGFLEQPGFPLVRVERIPGGVRLTQTRFATAGVELPPLSWQVPVTLAWADAEGGVERRSVLLGPSGLDVDLPGDPVWVRPNAGAAGYYRWSIPPRDLATLLAAGESAQSPRERIELLGNLEALMTAGEVSGEQWIRALDSMTADPHPQVLGAVIAAMNGAHAVFGEQPEDRALALWARTTLRGARDRIGWVPVADEDPKVAVVRPQLMTLLGTWGEDSEVRREGARLGRAFLEDEAAVDPSLARTVLELAVRDGDSALFEEIAARWRNESDPGRRARWLRTLGTFHDPVVRERALAWTLEEKLSPQEVLTIPSELAGAGEDARDRVVDWALAHADEITARVPGPSRMGLLRLAGSCSEERLGRLAAYYEARSIPGAARAITRQKDAVAACRALREAQGESVRAVIAAGQP
ncbi:MAG: M1 family metallopeptidase [bacterium]